MLEPDRLVSGETNNMEESFDRALRPISLKDYVGQGVVKEQLGIFVEAARKRSEPLDHCLVFGPPGLGKTTLAHIIAHEMGVDLKTTSGPVLEKAGDIAALMTNLEPGDVLFIDEIHRLSPVVAQHSSVDISSGTVSGFVDALWRCSSESRARAFRQTT